MTTTYTFEQLKADVKKEAEALRVHATEEERGRLNFDTLEPNHAKLCVYGQMTGECDSRRASFLIKNSAPVYIDCHSEAEEIKTIREFRTFHWSPIEFYIISPEAKNADLIAFLRGETETLDL